MALAEPDPRARRLQYPIPDFKRLPPERVPGHIQQRRKQQYPAEQPEHSPVHRHYLQGRRVRQQGYTQQYRRAQADVMADGEC